LDSLSNETFNKLGHKKKKFLEIFWSDEGMQTNSNSPEPKWLWSSNDSTRKQKPDKQTKFRGKNLLADFG
jgi:hypothetical protein